jgi:ATP-dependent Clp protease ATP-binding subunit ClpA
MNIEKYTERARGFIQSAQSLAMRDGHQQFTALHLLKVLLDDSEGLAGGLIDRAGGNAAKGFRKRRRAGLSRARTGARIRRGGEGRRESGRQLCNGRATVAGIDPGKG